MTEYAIKEDEALELMNDVTKAKKAIKIVLFYFYFFLFY